MYITKKGMYNMAVNFYISINGSRLNGYSVCIENYRIDIESLDVSYRHSVYYNKERDLNDIKSNIIEIKNIDVIKGLTINILNLIKDNLILLNSTFEYRGSSFYIDKSEWLITRSTLSILDWSIVLTEILVNLRKYILNLKELVTGHVIINNVLVREGDLVKIKKKIQKIEKLCITPGNKDICIVKYMFNPEYYVEYEPDIMRYINGVSNKESKLFDDYYRVAGGYSMENERDKYETW